MRKCHTALEAELEEELGSRSMTALLRCCRAVKGADMRRWRMDEWGPEQRLGTTEDGLEVHEAPGIDVTLRTSGTNLEHKF